MDFKRGNRIKVIEGIYVGKEFDIDVIAGNAPKSIGVVLETGKGKMTCWFRPGEVMKLQ